VVHLSNLSTWEAEGTGRRRREDHEFKISLYYIARPYLKKHFLKGG
jgi:hypothetical protein